MKKKKLMTEIRHLVILLVALLVVLMVLYAFFVLNNRDRVVDQKKHIVEEVAEPLDVTEEEARNIPTIEEKKGTNVAYSDSNEIGRLVLNQVKVAIYKGRFYPSEVTISPGTKVTWTNNDTFPHKIVSYDRVFYGSRMSPGDEYSFTFTNEGVHTYFDAIFPKTGRGKVIVREEPLPITGGVIGVDLSSEGLDGRFGLLVVLFVVMVFGLAHGMYKSHLI